MNKEEEYNKLHKAYLDIGGPEFDDNDIDQACISYAYNTCGIEGNTISLGETESIIISDHVIPGKSLREHLEIKDAYHAFKEMFMFIKVGHTMTEYLAMTFHHLNTKSWLDEKHSGKYKTISNRVGGRTTPYPEKAKVLFKALFNENQQIPDPFKRAADLHLKTVIIHPWQDGNGRTSRMMMNFELVKNGHGHLQIAKKEKDSYFKAIRASIGSESVVPFTDFLYDVGIRTYEKKIKFLSEKKNSDETGDSIWGSNTRLEIYGT